VGVFATWPQINSIAQGMGAKPIAYDPMLDYWLRMICGAFTLVGVWYLVLALWPRKFAVAIPWFGWLMIAEGVILLISGLRLGVFGGLIIFFLIVEPEGLNRLWRNIRSYFRVWPFSY